MGPQSTIQNIVSCQLHGGCGSRSITMMAALVAGGWMEGNNVMQGVHIMPPTLAVVVVAGI